MSGQTGAYLAELLLKSGHQVVGATRNLELADFWRLRALGISDSIEFVSIEPSSSDSVRQSIERLRPDHVYYLSGPSSVAQSWVTPVEAIYSITAGPLNFLETLRALNRDIHFFHASSSDCFGDQSGTLLDESSRFAPTSPYAIGKAASHSSAVLYRENYGMFVSNGILSNHESALRGELFVTRKVFNYLREAALEPQPPLRLGNTSVIRDWLWTPDVARAIYAMMSAPQPDDFIVASGNSHPLKDLIEIGAEVLGVKQPQLYEESAELFRATDVPSVKLNPAKISAELGWKPSVGFRELVRLLALDLA